MAWFPSVFENSSSVVVSEVDGQTSANGKSKGKGKGKTEEEQGPPTAPVLAFSWGNVLKVIRIEEVRVKQVMKNAKTGKEREVEVGAVDYRDVVSWTAEEEILAVQWLSPQVRTIQSLCRNCSLNLRDGRSNLSFLHPVRWAYMTCPRPR
jgi:hypothetical protein